MTIKYLKKAPLHSRSDDTKTQQIVRDILHDIENGRDETKAVANKVTDTNLNDGVAKSIEELFLNK